MLTAGVDLATQPAKTAVARVLWSHRKAELVELDTYGTDAAIIAVCQAVDFVGIDAPFGWPDTFTAFVDRHQRNTQTVEDGRTDDSRRSMAFRLTDHIVAKEFGRWPLSVSTDRIGLTAMRASSLLAQLRDLGESVDRAGGGRFAEVYPAVALKVWGLRASSYKGANSTHLPGLVDTLLELAPWLSLGPYESVCRQNDDAFDAIIAALISRAHALGRWRTPSEDQAVTAAREGWIVVPTAGLSELIG
jgi:predicted nuclease with RNAse H fold